MNDLIDSINPRGKVVQNEEIYHMLWRSSVCVNIWTLSTILGHFIHKYCVFDVFLPVISATYGPIFMKLCMLVKSHVSHVFTMFCNVLSFRLGFIGLWLYVATPPFKMSQL